MVPPSVAVTTVSLTHRLLQRGEKGLSLIPRMCGGRKKWLGYVVKLLSFTQWIRCENMLYFQDPLFCSEGKRGLANLVKQARISIKYMVK